MIEGYDGWNDHATSQLFGYAIPSPIEARATYAVSPHIGLMGMVVNGWDVARDNNRSPSIGGQLALTPSERASLCPNTVWGPERPGNNDDMRTVVDMTATFKVRPQLILGTNLTGARRQRRGARNGRDLERIADTCGSRSPRRCTQRTRRELRRRRRRPYWTAQTLSCSTR